MVPYLPLRPEVLKAIARLQLERIAARVKQSFGAVMTYDADLIELLAARSTDASAGARSIESLLTRTLLPDLSALVLARMAEGKPIAQVAVGVDSAGSFQCELQ